MSVRPKWKAFQKVVTCEGCGDAKGHAGVLPTGLAICVKCGWRGSYQDGKFVRTPYRRRFSDPFNKRNIAITDVVLRRILDSFDADATRRRLKYVRGLTDELADEAVSIGVRYIDDEVEFQLGRQSEGPMMDGELAHFSRYAGVHGAGFLIPLVWRGHVVNVQWRSDDAVKSVGYRAVRLRDTSWPWVGVSHIAGNDDVAFITEGAFKAIALRVVFKDATVIWTVGVHEFERAVEYARRYVRPRHGIFLFPDADVFTNEAVFMAVLRASARQPYVYVFTWPIQFGRGFDDLVLSQGVDKARQLMVPIHGDELEIVMAMNETLEALPRGVRRRVNRMIIPRDSAPSSQPTTASDRTIGLTFFERWKQAFEQARIVCDTSPFGSGKTYASVLHARGLLRDIGAKRYVILTDSPLNYPVDHKYFQAIIGRTSRGWVFDLNGMRWHEARDGEKAIIDPNCPYADRIEELIKDGIIHNVTMTICKRCQRYDDCAYLEQFRAGRKYVLMHPMTYLRHIHKDDLIVIDEFRHDLFVDVVSVPLKQAWEYASALSASVFIAKRNAGRALQRRLRQVSNDGPELDEHDVRAWWQYVREQAYTVDELVAYVLYGHTLQQRFDAIAPEWANALMRRDSRVVRHGKSLYVSTPRRAWMKAIEKGCRVLILDATPDVRTIAWAFREKVHITSEADEARPVVVQVASGRLLKSQHADSTARRAAKLALRGMRAVETRIAGKRLQWGVITLKRHADTVSRELGIPMDRVGWLGRDERGSNKFIDCTGLVLIGHLCENISAILARKGVQPNGDKPQFEVMDLDGGFAILHVSAGEQTKAMLEAVRANYRQALGRLRQSRSTEQKYVLVYDAVAHGLPIDYVLAVKDESNPSIDVMRLQHLRTLRLRLYQYVEAGITYDEWDDDVRSRALKYMSEEQARSSPLDAINQAIWEMIWVRDE